MRIIRSPLLSQLENVVHGMSTRDFSRQGDTFGFNLSFGVADEPVRVESNRKEFFARLGTDYSNAAYQKQIHSDIIKIVKAPGYQGESDAMITNVPDIALAVSAADCVPVLLYDAKRRVIAAVHAGWRGTRKRILERTLEVLIDEFYSVPTDIYAYVAPSICQEHYEVGKEVAEIFPETYVENKKGKFYLDVAGMNVQMLKEFDVPVENISLSSLCTYEEQFLHSYRRDRETSGRALAVIMLKK